MNPTITLTAEKAEKLMVAAALANAKDIHAAAKKLITLYKPHHTMIKGKHVTGPSIIECAVSKVLDEIARNPFA